jgi:beta-glucosidase/6-phospho-beta-glucosidase/beta-galactosidase
MFMPSPRAVRPFASFFLGGFECSSHKRLDGTRLDLLSGTGHAEHAEWDYARLGEHGIRTVRDGLRWHLIERSPGRYDWSSLTAQLRASRETGTQILWDLCHYGLPDDLDIWSAAFVDRFADYAAVAARIIGEATEPAPFYCPVNEISYWAWAGGEFGRFHPACHGRGAELKRQLVRAAIASIDAIRSVDPRARFLTAEPLIAVEPGLGDEAHRRAAETYHGAQYEVLDMMAGRMEPELGGAPEFVDLVGLNYYPENQWYHGGPTIPIGHHAYRPLQELLADAHRRYGRPILLAETGAEGCGRASWLHYVCGEVLSALEAGIPVEGICLYPILDYPGWENGRICRVGLLSMPERNGERQVFAPLARELRRQQELFAAATPDRQPLPISAAA